MKSLNALHILHHSPCCNQPNEAFKFGNLKQYPQKAIKEFIRTENCQTLFLCQKEVILPPEKYFMGNCYLYFCVTLNAVEFNNRIFIAS